MKSALRLELPPRGTLRSNNAVDPLAFYYKPLVGRIFRARIDLGLGLLGDGYRSLLEIGYGSGFLLPTLARAATRVAGLDREAPPAGLDDYLAAHGARDVELAQADAEKMPFPVGAFDCVVAFSIFEHIGGEALEAALGEVARVLEPGGAFLIGCPAVHRAMSMAFAAIGFSGIDHHHVSDLSTILAAGSRWFTVEESAAWPPIVGDRLPLGWAPYTAARLRRLPSREERAVGAGSLGSAERRGTGRFPQ
jgi:SAM-dependent methyltransferase